MDGSLSMHTACFFSIIIQSSSYADYTVEYGYDLVHYLVHYSYLSFFNKKKRISIVSWEKKFYHWQQQMFSFFKDFQFIPLLALLDGF